MKKSLFGLAIFAPSIALTQSSIIPNGGFEIVSANYPAAGESGDDPYSSTFHYVDNIAYWAEIEGWTHFKKKIGCFGGVCSADVYPSGNETGVVAHSGNKYGHCRPGEYLLNEITSYMQSDHYYYIEFYVNVGATLNEHNRVGIQFFTDHPRMCFNGDDEPLPEGDADFRVGSGIIPGEWTRYGFIYKPTQNWEWFSLGDFADDNDNRAYTRWDDVKILDLGTSACPYQWIWENTVFDDVHAVYQASDFIYAGLDFDGTDISGPVVVKANSEIIFRSGGWIDLDTGFITEPGSYFATEIAPCQENPCPSVPDLTNQYFVCESTPTNIGSGTSPLGLFYDWSPGLYLNSDTLSNPLFIPPVDSVGQIEYDVIITTVCGGFSDSINPWLSIPNVFSHLVEHVTVGFDSNPNANPSISLSNTSSDNYDFSFDVQVSEHTEEVCITLVEHGGTNSHGPVCLNRFTDFTDLYFGFTYHDLPLEILNALSVCHDYDIVVTAKNFCFDTTVADTFFWDRSSTLNLVSVPNIITPPNPDGAFFSNGLNDEFCIEATGADNYLLTVSATWGIVHSSGGAYTAAQMCIWDGRCTEFPPCTGTYLSEGTYAVMVEVTNECGQSEAYNDYVVINYDELETHMAVISDSATTATANESGTGEIKVFPNPASHKITVQISEAAAGTKITLHNNLGQQLGLYPITGSSLEIDVSALEQGVYFLEVEQDHHRKNFKIIVSR